ncbi:MAG: microviridin/marinostatin family tricyclic proteinase inhibitor [Acidobacteriota bacterium]
MKEDVVRENRIEEKEKGAVPFFARYLEGQNSLRVRTNIKAGCGVIVTLKYPSDSEDVTTQKFPSDNDEVG